MLSHKTSLLSSRPFNTQPQSHKENIKRVNIILSDIVWQIHSSDFRILPHYNGTSCGMNVCMYIELEWTMRMRNSFLKCAGRTHTKTYNLKSRDGMFTRDHKQFCVPGSAVVLLLPSYQWLAPLLCFCKPYM